MQETQNVNQSKIAFNQMMLPNEISATASDINTFQYHSPATKVPSSSYSLFKERNSNLRAKLSQYDSLSPSENRNSTSSNGVIAPFLKHLYEMLSVEDPSIISWDANGLHFEVHSVRKMEAVVLPKYFRHQKYASFQRQLNYFGFRKHNKSKEAGVFVYFQPHFCRDRPSLMKLIKRKTQSPKNRRKSKKKAMYSAFPLDPLPFNNNLVMAASAGVPPTLPLIPLPVTPSTSTTINSCLPPGISTMELPALKEVPSFPTEGLLSTSISTTNNNSCSFPSINQLMNGDNSSSTNTAASSVLKA